MNLIPTELNQRLASAVWYSVSADRFYISGKTLFWRLVGLGLVTFAVGVAIGFGCYGYSYITQNSDALNVLSSTFSKALAEVQLRAVAEGTVQLEPNEISLAKGPTVRLAPNSRVLLEPGARVLADGEVRVERIVSAPPSTTQRPVASTPTIIDFTVFKKVPFDKGVVVTGWNFDTSTQKSPTEQYCYYTESTHAAGVNMRLNLGTNEVIEMPNTVPENFDIQAAFNRCVWFRN